MFWFVTGKGIRAYLRDVMLVFISLKISYQSFIMAERVMALYIYIYLVAFNSGSRCRFELVRDHMNLRHQQTLEIELFGHDLRVNLSSIFTYKRNRTASTNRVHHSIEEALP